MKKHINLILVLMALCVVGIIGLQLFWNYQNYKSTVDTFQRDSNEALNAAVDQEMAQRHRQLVKRFKGWLADTSFITITCDTHNRERNTVFHIRERYPKYADSKGISFGLADFDEKLPRITPQAKARLIEHFGENKLKEDMKKGLIYYYTPRLGDSLETAYKNSSVNRAALTKLYQKLLAEKGIQTSFVLNQETTQTDHYVTKPVNTSLRRPYKKDLVWAGFESPDTYFLKTMKWVIVSTLLLITIALICFGYTAKTLLSQHKLAELKDSFISNMTHELNTPLASIKITAEALKTFAYPPETQKAYLDIIGHQTDKLTALTTQILNTNRLIRSSEETWQGLDINALMTKAIDDLAVRLDQQQAVVHYEPLSETALVRGEAASLTNVFTNIIDNALKYAPHQTKLDIRLSAKHKQVEIAFADNGIGIPTEYQDKVFERFFRVPQGNVHDVKGYGLGLSYVRQVIQQHRGSVRVRANQPCGSVFIVQLPLL